jgi:hypothetical protein
LSELVPEIPQPQQGQPLNLQKILKKYPKSNLLATFAQINLIKWQLEK